MQKKFEYLLCISLFLTMVILCTLMYIIFTVSIDYEPVIIPQIEPIPYQKEVVSTEPVHMIHDMDVINKPEVDPKDVEMLAKLIQSEAGNQSYTGRVLVADVVINRVENPKFPNTLEEVINQKNQFSVVKNGMFETAGKNLNEENIKIATQELIAIKRYNDGVLYFGTGKFNGKDFFKEDDHWFSY